MPSEKHILDLARASWLVEAVLQDGYSAVYSANNSARGPL